MAIQVGDIAPKFTLHDCDTKQPVSLKDFKGQNIVLLFFPQAFTSVCTEELCAMRDNIGNYEKLNAAVVAISVDSVFTLAQFKATQHYNFPMLSDFNKKASKAYDAFYKDFFFDMKGVSKRAAFVIDAKGIVRYAEVLENAGNVPDFKAVNAILASLS